MRTGQSARDLEHESLEKVLHASIVEQRRTRRWRIFFRLVYLSLFLFVVSLLFRPASPPIHSNTRHVAQINIDGLIAAEAIASNADSIIAALTEAYDNAGTTAVILRINSPGGSAVESGRVYDEVMRLRKLHPDIKVYAVVDEMAASAAYYIAAATDEIYANRASIVGSIGVMIDSFGFVEGMKKLGVERRLITAGEHKGMLDPFSPMSQHDLTFTHALIDSVYQQFITAVKEGRGDRLADNPEIFSGLIWTGEQAEKLGLIDGLGDAHYVARELVGVDDIVSFNPPINFFDMFAMRLGATFAETLTKQSGFQF